MGRPKGSKSTVRASDLMAMLEKQEYKCALSGRPLTPETASIDHILPICKGGDHELANLWIVDSTLNRSKHTLTLDEFVELCRDVAKFQGNRTSTERM